MKKTQRKTTTVVEAEIAPGRYAELKRMLEERRRDLQAEVQGRMRDVRAEGQGGKTAEVFDDVESSEADIQDDIELALIQMKSETLSKINDALARLEQGVALRRALSGLRGSARERGAA